MVTIDPDNPIGTLSTPQKTPAPNQTQKGGFDAIFRETLVAPPVPIAATESTAVTGNVLPAPFAGAPDRSTPMMVDRLQRLIDTMEAYQQRLMAGNATLKEVQPLVERLEKHSQPLSALSGAAQQPDSLVIMVNQAVMLASMEVARFKSGHYNDP
jgi:hypothetical protein